MNIKHKDYTNRNFPHKVRTIRWRYDVGITVEEAETKAHELLEAGVNMVILEGHRFIFPLPDDPAAYNDPFHFTLWPTEKSNAATGIVVDALRVLDMKIMHHTTAGYCPKLEMEKHRDWCQQNLMKPGEPVFFGEYGGVYLYCLNNPEFRNAYFKQMADLQRRFRFDAWMIDEVEWLPDWYSCVCPHCRARFKEETGYDLPEDPNSEILGDFDNPVWRAWISARMRWPGAFFKDIRSYFNQEGIGREMILTSCHAGVVDSWSAQYWGIDLIDLVGGIEWMFYEAYIYCGVPFYSWRRYLAEMEVYGALARARTTYPAFVLYYPKSDKTELEWCASACFALGERHWANYDPVRHFTWERDHEDLYYIGGSELVDVGLVHSKATRDLIRHGTKQKFLDASNPDSTRGYVDEWGAWAEVLVEMNIPHCVVMDWELATADLSQYKALFLPSTECLSDVQVEALIRYADNGGRLVVSGEPARCDETGKLRDTDSELLTRLRSLIYKKVDASLAESAYRSYVRYDRPVVNKPKAVVEKFQEELNTVVPVHERVFCVDAPIGAVVKAFLNKNKTALKISVLNCLNRDLPSGTVLTETYKTDYTSGLATVKIHNPLAGLTAVRATLYQPQAGDAVPADLSVEGDWTVVKVPLASALSVVEITHQ